MSLMTQRCRSGTRGLSDYLWFYLYLHLWITCDYLWLWMNLFVILKFICIYALPIYLYELPVMPIVNYLWWMWCLFECGTWLWPNLINWLFVAALPSVTLGKEAFCRVPGLKHSAKCTRGKIMCILGLKWLLYWVSALWHSAKKPKFCAFWDMFAECLVFDTRQRTKVCRVPVTWHTTNE